MASDADELDSAAGQDDAADEKPKRETLVPYCVRLRSDQVAFLRTVGNAARWIRDAIDSIRARAATSSPAERVVLLSRELENVRAELHRVHEGGRAAYEACEGLADRIEATQAAIPRHKEIAESSSIEDASPLKRESMAALARMNAELPVLEHEYQVQCSIMHGFSDKKRELEAREKTIEDELVQAGTARSGK